MMILTRQKKQALYSWNSTIIAEPIRNKLELREDATEK